MRIEIGTNPNCSESVARFRTDKLTEDQEQELFAVLQAYVEKYDYETNISKTKVFGIKCIVIDGNAPYNDHDGMIAATEKLTFMDKVKIEEDEQ